jgi:hypothetical protein
LRERKTSKDPLRPTSDAERDAELDQALRLLGDELLSQEIPDRLLRLLRSAADAEEQAQQEDRAERDRRFKPRRYAR